MCSNNTNNDDVIDSNIKIGVVGCTGKTGSSIVKLLFQGGYNISAGVVSSIDKHTNFGSDIFEKNVDIGNTSGVITGINITDNIYDLFACSDVVIDFSSPQGLEKCLNANICYNRCLVSGTTNHELDTLLKKAGHVSKVFWAPNMSVILNSVSNIINSLAEKLGDKYTINMLETHHAKKKDIPSGTAKMIMDSLVQNPLVYQDKWNFYNEIPESQNAYDDNKSIHCSSVRIGNEVGEHKVVFADENEQISISHRSFSRDVFAKGAIQCALWLFKQDVGLYSMKDYIYGR